MEVWDRLEEENHKQYRAFVMYYHIPTGERSLRAAERATGHSINTIRSWSHTYDWQERAAAHDIHEYKTNHISEQEILKNNQQVVVDDGFEDYAALVSEWKKLMADEDDMTVNRLSNLITARLKIDTIGRRAAALPTVHQATEVIPEEKAVALKWSSTPTLITGTTTDSDD